MSICAINAAYEAITGSDMTPAVASTLVALAHCHNDRTGQCDPSLGYLSAKTRLTDRAVRKALRELEGRRLVLTTFRKHTEMRSAWNRSNSYRLLFVGKQSAHVHANENLCRNSVPGGGELSSPNRE